jgi:hypothetical protein
VRASVFERTKDRAVSIAPSERETVTIPFTSVQNRSWPPTEHVTALVQVTKGKDLLDRTQMEVRLRPVEDRQECSG